MENKTHTDTEFRPICPKCHTKLTYIQFKGYYDEFEYWEFDCKCAEEISFKIDKIDHSHP